MSCPLHPSTNVPLPPGSQSLIFTSQGGVQGTNWLIAGNGVIFIPQTSFSPFVPGGPGVVPPPPTIGPPSTPSVPGPTGGIVIPPPFTPNSVAYSLQTLTRGPGVGGGFKISETDSPQPADRFSYTYTFYNTTREQERVPMGSFFTDPVTGQSQVVFIKPSTPFIVLDLPPSGGFPVSPFPDSDPFFGPVPMPGMPTEFTTPDPWAILQSTPGVLSDRINVGGNEATPFVGYGGFLVRLDSVDQVTGVPSFPPDDPRGGVMVILPDNVTATLPAKPPAGAQTTIPAVDTPEMIIQREARAVAARLNSKDPEVAKQAQDYLDQFGSTELKQAVSGFRYQWVFTNPGVSKDDAINSTRNEWLIVGPR